MSIVVIGDRGVGKTSMVVALAKLATKHVQVVSDAESLVARRFNIAENRIAGTAQMTLETLLMNVHLPSGIRQIQILWVDTPGEAFSNRDWKTKYPTAWQDIQQQISESKGVILLLPPYRDILQPQTLDERTVTDDLPTTKAWINRLENWLIFFQENCSHVEHILICIHRADTFCNIKTEGKKWRYEQSKPSLFYEYNTYIRKTYFTPAEKLIREYHRILYASLQFFITTTDNEQLLELPWIYLGAFLANS
jgi:GTPase SAR1 family protein